VIRFFAIMADLVAFEARKLIFDNILNSDDVDSGEKDESE